MPDERELNANVGTHDRGMLFVWRSIIYTSRATVHTSYYSECPGRTARLLTLHDVSSTKTEGDNDEGGPSLLSREGIVQRQNNSPVYPARRHWAVNDYMYKYWGDS